MQITAEHLFHVEDIEKDVLPDGTARITFGCTCGTYSGDQTLGHGVVALERAMAAHAVHAEMAADSSVIAVPAPF